MRSLPPLASCLVVILACSNSSKDSSISPDNLDGGTLGDGGSSATGGINASGARLKIQAVTGDDGSTFVTGLYDTGLNVPCSYGRATDGTLRCLPGGLSMSVFFSDSGCSQLLAYQGASCSTTPPYATLYMSCPLTSEVHQVGAQYFGNVYTGTPASCTQVTGATLTTSAFYSVGAALPPSGFVQGTEGTK